MEEVKQFKRQLRELRRAEDEFDVAGQKIAAVLRSMPSTIRAWRKKSSIGLRSFARTMAISPSYLSDIELGRRPLTDRLIYLIVKQMENNHGGANLGRR